MSVSQFIWLLIQAEQLSKVQAAAGLLTTTEVIEPHSDLEHVVAFLQMTVSMRSFILTRKKYEKIQVNPLVKG